MTTTQAIKLTAAQQQLIVSAAANPTSALVPARAHKGRILDKMLEALLGQGLVRKVRTKADLPLWRQDEDGKRYSLVLTKAGHAAAARVGRVAEEKRSAAGQSTEARAPSAGKDAITPRSGSKLAGVIDLLRREDGAPVSELMAITGWLPHTTRAALTGLRKRGYAVVRQVADGGSVYRIEDHAPAAAA